MKPRITMIGTGYVGLVSGTCFAEMGMDVTCVDIDAEKIRKLTEENIIPIYEPGLDELVARNQKAGRLHFTTDLSTCVPNSDAVFIAVGTPQDEDGSADMQYVLQAAEDIAKNLSGYTVIVNKSTVPVGTGQRVEDRIKSVNPQAEFDVCSNPEFLREGAAIGDFMKPDRIVVGCPNEKSAQVMKAIYKPQTDEGYSLLITNRESSELIKYAANAFLATKITFINEIANLCEKVGADVMSVSEGIGLDTRIGSKFLQPGPGYGGSCFPKDTNALAFQGQEFDAPQTIVEKTIEANENIKKRLAEKVAQALGGSIQGKKVAVLGLAFKADTDDMRDAPALTILPELEKLGATLVAYDPEAHEQAQWRMPNLALASSKEEALEGADIAVILTEWQEFKTMDVQAVAEQTSSKTIVDLRNLFNPADMADLGVQYISIGR
ncbi:MAG: UDP-glucose/GDP-mannose dehydrogenase family protein [Pseudomonadota bacterium]|nr:UDP-glucose/GDP-mannose dehydrogenase family protein [Pseudomonadota bacterium]|tara:strand:+ start:19015 stop:20322 length:1308 start_codon:yes stop_codon:yes gene_type:complete